MAPPHDRDPSDPLPFAVVRHGYDRDDVRRHLQRVGEETRRAQTDRDQLREQTAELSGQLQIAQREIAALTERLEGMATEVLPKSAQQEHATRAVKLAEAQAAEITDRAQAAADHTWSAAEEASAALRERYQRLLADLVCQHEELHAEHEEIMRSARTKVEEMTTVAHSRRKEIDEQGQAERERIERQFQSSIGRRREQLDAELAERRSAAEQHSEQLVRDAVRQANERIATANDELTRLGKLRTAVVERLRSTHNLIEQSAELLKPLDEEAELTVIEGGDKPLPPELREPEPTQQR